MPTADWERGYAAGYSAGFNHHADLYPSETDKLMRSTRKGQVRKTARRAYEPKSKPKRKASAYSKRYGAAFKRLAPKYKLKNGKWGKNGFKRCAAAARREAKRT